MFQSARMKLTLWYLLIIMAVSIAFSTVIFVGSTTEFDRVLRAQEYRLSHPEFRVRSLPGNIFQLQSDDGHDRIDPQVISEAKNRLLIELIGVNTVILLLSAVAGYFLAGRTLRPIQLMVDEQKRFITDASHELNTPLTSLRTTIEVNLRSKELSIQKAKDVLKSNLEDVGSLQLLSEELIGLTQYEELPPVVSSASIALDESLSEAIRIVEPLSKKKKIVFSEEGSGGQIMADKKSITQLFVILFDNAVKYSPSGRKVSIKSEVVNIMKTDELKRVRFSSAISQ